MPLNMEGKKVIVTGASRGIGAEIARAYHESGAEVIGTRTQDASPNGRCDSWVTVDFTNDIQTLRFVDALREIQPDVLINNAGINKIGPFAEIGLHDFLQIQKVNVVAPFLLSQAVIPAMAAKRWGRIVNISSIWGKISKEFRATYSASKFALDGITAAISAEHARDGIMANCVSPGFTRTELTERVLGADEMSELSSIVPARRFAEPSEIAKFVLWLGSEENTYLTGQNIALDGGFTRV